MLWMGEEFGESTRQTPNRQNKLHWCFIELIHCWTMPDNAVYFLLQPRGSALTCPQALIRQKPHLLRELYHNVQLFCNSLLNYDLNRDLLEYYKRLIALRKSNPALYTENIEFFHENPSAKVFAYIRWNDEGSRAIVVANFSDTYLARYKIPNFPATGTWHEWAGDCVVEAREDGLTIDLPEYEAKVLVCFNYPA